MLTGIRYVYFYYQENGIVGWNERAKPARDEAISRIEYGLTMKGPVKSHS